MVGAYCYYNVGQCIHRDTGETEDQHKTSTVGMWFDIKVRQLLSVSNVGIVLSLLFCRSHFPASALLINVKTAFV